MTKEEMIADLEYRRTKTREIAELLQVTPVTLENKELILEKAAEFTQLIEDGLVIHDANPDFFTGMGYCGDKKRFTEIIEFKRVRAAKL